MQPRSTLRLVTLVVIVLGLWPEPIYNKVSIDGSRKGYRLVKREDPHHPMLVVEWPGAADRFGLWKGIGDIFATDLYPIPREKRYGLLPNHDITQMRDYIAALKK